MEGFVAGKVNKMSLAKNQFQKVIDTIIERGDSKGPLASCPELSVFVSCSLQALSMEYFKLLEAQMMVKGAINPEIKFILEHYNMIKLIMYHVSIEVVFRPGTEEEGYPHRIPTTGRYPYRPTIDALSQTIDFFDALQKVVSKNPSIPQLDSSVYIFFSNYTKTLSAKEHHSETKAVIREKAKHQFNQQTLNEFSFEQALINYPAKEYYLLKERIKNEGLNARFPEFEAVIKELIKKIQRPFVESLTKVHPFSNAVKNKIFRDLGDVQVEQCPYIKTIFTIMKTLDFFDALDRTYKNNIPPLYHADRYTYYAQILPYSVDYILVPSTMPLTFIDLIKLRSAPLAIMGVSTSTTFADGYFNSPKDFYVHDANHNRRFNSYNQLYKERVGFDGHSDFETFINKNVLPAIEIKDEMVEEEIELRKMMTVVFFEFLHEFAYTPDRNSLIEAFKFKSAKDKGPFEIMYPAVPGAEEHQNTESRRLPNNNLQSGITMFMESEKIHTEMVVENFFDRLGLNFIKTIANKFEKSFYENIHWDIHAKDLPTEKYRSHAHIAKAALQVMALYGIDPQIDLGWECAPLKKLEQIAGEQVDTDSFGKDSGRVPAYNSDLVANTLFVSTRGKIRRAQTITVLSKEAETPKPFFSL